MDSKKRKKIHELVDQIIDLVEEETKKESANKLIHALDSELSQYSDSLKNLEHEITQ